MYRLKKGESKTITVRGRTGEGLRQLKDGSVGCSSSDPKVLKIEPGDRFDRFTATFVGPGAAKVTNLLTIPGRAEPFREVLMFECLEDQDGPIDGVGSEVS